jgi:estrone sulfotransferase
VIANRHRGLRPDDLFIASYPRSGNTWIRFVLADLATGSQASFESIDRMFPGVGMHRDAPALAGGHRLIKTHEAHRREYVHAVYVIRDVRDVLISWYRVLRNDPENLEGLDAFVGEFVSGTATPYGSWSDHVKSWQRARDGGLPITIQRFEDLQSRPQEVVSEIAKVLEIPAEPERVRTALERNNPEAMRRLETEGAEYLRRAVGQRSKGVRQGKVGGWRELLTDEHMRMLAPELEFNAELGYE